MDDAVPQLVVDDHLPEPRALDLAARRLGNGAGLDEKHACRPMPAPAADTLDDLANHAAQPLDLLGALAHLGHHVEALAARPLALDAHGRRVSDTRHVIHDLLDVDGDEIRAPENDEVLQTAADEEEAFAVEKAQIARAQPSVRGENAPRRLGILVVALHDPGALHADLSLHPRADRPRLVHDAHGDALARRSDGEEPARAIEPERCLARPDRHGQRRLGEAVAGCDQVGDVELLLEGLDGAEADRLGARERLLERREIDARRVADISHAVPEAEVGRDGEGRLDARHQLEPGAGVLEIGRQEPEGRADGRRGEGAADQPHVVVEGQPRDDHVLARELGRFGHEGHRLRDVGMAQHHAAGTSRASRGVLDEGRVAVGGGGEGGHGGVRLEVLRLEHVAHGGHAGLALLHAFAEPADGGDDLGLGVPKDVGGGLDTQGRIEGDGHRAEAQGSEEREEELLARRVDEADLVAALHSRLAQSRRVARALSPEIAVGHRLVVEVEVGRVWIGRDPPAHQVHQRRRRFSHQGAPPR